MKLGLAGAISGAGEGASKALTMGQAQYGAEHLQSLREKADEERQQRLIEHQASEGALTRGAAEKEGLANRASAEANLGMQLTETRYQHEADRGSREQMSKDTLVTQKEMNAATNATHLTTAKLQRQMQEKQFDKTFTAAKLSALKDTVRELGNEITRLSVVVSNPLADKTDPSYKAATLQLESATNLHNLYAKEVGLQIGVGDQPIDRAITKPTLPPFKMPSMGTTPTPPPTRREGVIQTPAPSAAEQEMMRKSIQQ